MPYVGQYYFTTTSSTSTSQIRIRPGAIRYPSYEDAIAAMEAQYKPPETLQQVIQRLHRRQQFYLTHKKDFPSW